MALADDFKTFCKNLILTNKSDMETSAGEIAKKLNSVYYGLTDDKTTHMYIVGSVGRQSAIKGSSDLDLIFDLPNDVYKKFNDYESNGQSALLQEVKNHLKERYPKTDLKGDGQVVVIDFNNYTVELVPGFKQSDDRFKYPDTNNGGSWKYTDPLPEQNESNNFNTETNGNFLNLCHIIRAWKNNKGFKFGGLLIDTLAYDFLHDKTFYKTIGYDSYLDCLKELFKYLKGLNKEQSFWYALGSNQCVYNTDNGKFIDKANNAYDDIKDLKEETDNINNVLRELLGNEFPKQEVLSEQASYSSSPVDREEFIYNKFPVDIRINLILDCNVIQDGFRNELLSIILRNKSFLRINKKLEFFIKNYKDIQYLEPFDIYWKVKNVGEIARNRNQLRGQIIKTNDYEHKEKTDFTGPHFVECYIVKNGVCIAKGRINVPINSQSL